MKHKKNVARYVSMPARQLRAATAEFDKEMVAMKSLPLIAGERAWWVESPPKAGPPAPRTRRQDHLREP
jgi:hypothetical protein